MCKNRWRPYMKPSPAHIISRYGIELGKAIIEKNIEAVSAIAICTGKWIALIGGEVYPSPINGIKIPATFDDAHVANEWLLETLPALDLFMPECIEHSNRRIAYKVYCPLQDAPVVAELVAVTQENENNLRQRYLTAAGIRQ